MKNQIGSLLLFVLMIYCGCKTSTQPDIRPSVTLITDSLRYNRSSGIAQVHFQIQNITDSTLLFPSCGQIRFRIDTKIGNSWSEGNPNWNSACIAIYPPNKAIRSDSVYTSFLTMSTIGIFRLVTIYGYSPEFFQDTLLSNEFTIL